MPTDSNDTAGQTADIAGPIHPREHLAEIMQELGVTQYRLARTIGVPPIRIHDIVHDHRVDYRGLGASNRKGAGDDTQGNRI